MTLKTVALTEDHQAMLEKRGISPEIAVALGWLTCVERKGDWIAMPFLRKGKVVNHKYRRIVKLEKGQNFEQDTGGEQCFYNLAALEDLEILKTDELRQQQVVITEGEFDCAAALKCGYLAVSVPSGAPAEKVDADSTKFDFVRDFPKFAIAILAVDDDPAGQVLRYELATRLGWHRCKWVQYPKGCKDLTDVIAKYGEKGVNVVLREKARFMNVGGVFRMSELPTLPEHRAYECGIGNLSEMIRLRAGDLSIFTGIPSMGKTQFVNCMAGMMARLYGWDVCFGSFEQPPQTDHKRYLRTFHTGKPAKDLLDSERAEADRWIDKHFVFIVPDENTDELVTLKWVLDRARAAITQHGVQWVIIDPWNELDHDRPQGMSLTEYTGFAIKEFKRLARQYMIHVSIVAHPAKMEKNKDGSYNAPTLYDISDSSHWYNKCDLGVVIHRDENNEGKWGTLVKVAKVRYWNVIGRIGEKYLEYLPDRGLYIDAPDFVRKGSTKANGGSKPKAGETATQPGLPYKD